MSPKTKSVRRLACCFQAGPLTRRRMLASGGLIVRGRGAKRWLPKVVERLLATFPERSRPGVGAMMRVIQADEALMEKVGRSVLIDAGSGQTQMLPTVAFAECEVPAILNYGGLAEWLNVSVSELEWFCDAGRFNQKRKANDSLQHYRWAKVEKRSGGHRLLEAPKERLKMMQRKILREILDRVPVHGAAKGFVRDGSVRAFAEPHCGKRLVLRMDLRNFFPGISVTRVAGLFVRLGYPQSVADGLAELCVTAAPDGVLAGLNFADAAMYRAKHLPQGSPASPALANLLMFASDCRLDGLVKASGGVYTRYADDLAFSWTRERLPNVRRFIHLAGAILIEGGFDTNVRKTRVLGEGGRQRVTGVLVNAHPNVTREEYDVLRAILCNCQREGIASQNRAGHDDFRAYLRGRIAWVAQLNPARGVKLLAQFAALER